MKVKLNKDHSNGTVAAVTVRNYTEFDTLCRAALAAGLKLWIYPADVLTTAYPLYAKDFELVGAKAKIAKFVEHANTAKFAKIVEK